MTEKIILEVLTPERLVLREEVDEAVAPGAEGDFGVLPGHCEFLTTLRAGELRYQIGGQARSLTVLGGFAEVRANRVIILADGMSSPVEQAAV